MTEAPVSEGLLAAASNPELVGALNVAIAKCQELVYALRVAQEYARVDNLTQGDPLRKDRSAAQTQGLVVVHCAPDRECERCGSVRLGVIEHDTFLRKECLDCGSTGPFAPLPKDGPHGY